MWPLETTCCISCRSSRVSTANGTRSFIASNAPRSFAKMSHLSCTVNVQSSTFSPPNLAPVDLQQVNFFSRMSPKPMPGPV